MVVNAKYLYDGDNLEDAYNIRRLVFTVEQGVDPEEEFDSLDKEAIHVVVYEKEKAVATGRLIQIDGKYKVGRVAVLKEERGKKYGDFVVRMLLDKAFVMNAPEVYIGAQKGAVGFYQKIGFEVCGEEFIEANIPHLPMKIRNGCMCKGCQKNNK